MIYVSSSCVSASTIGEAVRKLVDAGYQNIELSGGTKLYDQLENELISLKSEFGLNFLCHNYFPPPPQSFVVNLASLNEQIAHLSMEHLKRGIALSHKLDAKKFGFHAGFLMDIPLNELGRSIARQELFGREKALDKFATNLEILIAFAGDLQLYIENNVVSSTNLKNYGGVNPLLVTDSATLLEVQKRVHVPLLLDVAHLKVSCVSLGLSLGNELSALIGATDYIHISDNDGLTDSNKELDSQSDLARLLHNHNLSGKTLTLEVYTGPDKLRSSFETVQSLS